MTEPPPTELERQLAARRRDYEQVKARIAEVGFICEGSLVERWMSCGKPSCRCTDPAERHGPYYQLSWKEAGRTVSRRLTAEQARLYREWITNRRALDELVKQMKAVSRRANEHMLDEAAERAAGSGGRSPRGRRSPRSTSA